MTTEETLSASILKRAVAEFDQNRVSATAIRKLANDAPDLFASLGTELLLSGSDTPGYRFLALQLVKQAAVLDRLTDPWRFTLPQTIMLARILMKADPTLDIRLARRLPGRSGSVSEDTLQGGPAERALDILNEVSVGRRVVPILNHLIEHPDKKISSKAALLIGKRVQNLAWATRVIAEGQDSRIRANAIETIWGGNSDGALELFRTCLHDSDNRVVGNSIVGLHLAGDPEGCNAVVRFAEDFEPKFRMTAAWAMGRVGDPIFIPLLTPLIRDAHPGVRRAALHALHGIRQMERRQTKEVDAAVEAPAERQHEIHLGQALPDKEIAQPPFELRLDGQKNAR